MCCAASGSPIPPEGPGAAASPGHAFGLLQLAGLHAEPLVCGDAGIGLRGSVLQMLKACLSLCPSMHPSFYSCGEGSGPGGGARNNVVKF